MSSPHVCHSHVKFCPLTTIETTMSFIFLYLCVSVVYDFVVIQNVHIKSNNIK